MSDGQPKSSDREPICEELSYWLRIAEQGEARFADPNCNTGSAHTPNERHLLAALHRWWAEQLRARIAELLGPKS